MYRIQILPKTLHFKQPAGTSRGIYTTRKVWYVILSSDEYPERKGWGECAPLPQLSCDDLPNYEEILAAACREVEANGYIHKEALRPYPSILFGLETALRHYEQQSVALWNTPFSRGEAGIPINGLIWMGNYERMLEQIRNKMETGFRCIKLKIGAIHFEEELDLLAFIRKHFSAEEVELRVDANGAFQPDTALEKLKRLAELDIHSIEQPIYSFLTCTRSNETITVEPRDIVIVEGILILCNEELRNMMDMKVFVDADADDRLIRVINRDIIERGRTVEMVIERYERVLKPMHLQHIEPTKRYADIIIPQGGHNSVAIEIMTNFISHKLKG